MVHRCCLTFRSPIIMLIAVCLFVAGCGSNSDEDSASQAGSQTNGSGDSNQSDSNQNDSRSGDSANGRASGSATLDYLTSLREIQAEYELFRVPQVFTKATPIALNENKIAQVRALPSAGVDEDLVQLAQDALSNVEEFYQAYQEFAESVSIEDVWLFAHPDPLSTDDDRRSRRQLEQLAGFLDLLALERQTGQNEQRIGNRVVRIDDRLTRALSRRVGVGRVRQRTRFMLAHSHDESTAVPAMTRRSPVAHPNRHLSWAYSEKCHG